jgi:hypothetical protein
MREQRKEKARNKPNNRKSSDRLNTRNACNTRNARTTRNTLNTRNTGSSIETRGAAADNSRAWVINMRDRPTVVRNQPSTGQGGATEHGLVHTKVDPALLPIHLRATDQPERSPVLDQGLDALRAHRAVSEQIVVIPNTPTNQGSVVFEASLPTTWVFSADGGNADDEVNELGLNGHGDPWVVVELKTKAR